MFDDKTTTQPAAPSNLPVDPPDMFDGVDRVGASQGADQATSAYPDALSAGLLKKREEAAPADTAEASIHMMPVVEETPSIPEGSGMPVYAVKPPFLGKILLGIFITVVVAGLGYGGWRLYGKFILKNVASPSYTPAVLPPDFEGPLPPRTSAVPEIAEPLPAAPAVTATTDVTAGMVNDSILFGEPVDTDGDALDDIREKEIGTNPNKSDTDNDGLTDADEVIIWKTDPLNPDSDGDTHVDGKEVRNGYNPLGPGRLFNPPAVTTTSATSS